MPGSSVPGTRSLEAYTLSDVVLKASFRGNASYLFIEDVVTATCSFVSHGRVEREEGRERNTCGTFGAVFITLSASNMFQRVIRDEMHEVHAWRQAKRTFTRYIDVNCFRKFERADFVTFIRVLFLLSSTDMVDRAVSTCRLHPSASWDGFVCGGLLNVLYRLLSVTLEPPHRQATNWTLEKIVENPKQRFFKSHANLKDLPCGKAPGVKVRFVCVLRCCREQAVVSAYDIDLLRYVCNASGT